MYDWVTKNGRTWNPLAGACSHHCSYCYVEAMKEKFPVLREKYSGPPRLVEKELRRRFKSGETVFVCSMTDLFADNVPEQYIRDIIAHTRKFLDTTFLFQTKNPRRMSVFLNEIPDGSILGTTIETDSNKLSRILSDAPPVEERAEWMEFISAKIQEKRRNLKLMISIEPVLQFTPINLYYLIVSSSPNFVSIGADSKQNNLPEPSKEDILELIDALRKAKIEVRIKHNLHRIIGEVEA